MRRITALLPLLLSPLLPACHQQPSVQQTNAATDAQLNDIAAHTNATDGMDQGNDALTATPTVGQQLDAKQQPPKH